MARGRDTDPVTDHGLKKGTSVAENMLKKAT
jgi:hypothetical protein